MVVLLLAVGVLAVAGAAFGIGVTRRVAQRARAAGPPGDESGLVRVRAVVRTGLEQAVVGTVRSLGLPVGGEDVDYGRLYLESDGDSRLLVRSRSVIGRGLLAVLRFRSGERRTDVVYSIIRLPADEAVHQAVLQFEMTLVRALRRVDEAAEVHLASGALRSVERAPHGR